MSEVTQKPLTDDELAAFQARLYDALHCPICGAPMIHYRLRGYKCANEEHNERVAAMYAQDAKAFEHRGYRGKPKGQR